MSFKNCFNNIFSKDLEKYGFLYNKKLGKHIKIINGEIIQFISYIKSKSTKKGYQAFNVFSGMASIYCESLDDEWLRNLGIDLHTMVYNVCPEDRLNIQPIDYEYNNDTMVEVIELALQHTKEIILPLFDEVNDLNTYIYKYVTYCKRSCISGANRFNADSLALIVSDNHDNFNDWLQRDYDRAENYCKKSNRLDILDSERELLYRAIVTNIVEKRDEVYNDTELYSKAIDEAKTRKANNTFYLRENDLIV